MDKAAVIGCVMFVSLGCLLAPVIQEHLGNFITTGRLVSIFAVSLVAYITTPSTSSKGSSKFAAFRAGQRLDTSDKDAANREEDGANVDDEDEKHVPYDHERLSMDDIKSRSADFLNMMKMRRTLRFFSKDHVPYEVVENCVAAAGTAPSGAHCQPWHFAIISDDETKSAIKELVENEEERNYRQRMGSVWVDEVAGMVSQLPEAYLKPYLTDAPHVIVAFMKKHNVTPDGTKIPVRYPMESIGLACGILLSALQASNLVSLTSTPLGAEKAIRHHLGMPDHYHVFLLLPVGFPAKDATVPCRPDPRLPVKSIITTF